MNFQRFYTNTKKRLTDAALSLWATGEANMQTYLGHILTKEKLMAEPVIQSAFPWEAASQRFGDMEEVFDKDFIKALSGIKDNEFRFPIERHPYKHQVESWEKLLSENKSIAVTTGTGSGKTECFMLPVLYDLFKNCRNGTGVNAIFLYPLNALIGSQRKRMHAWCKAIGGVRYAVYNGQTDETSSVSAEKDAQPEVISRSKIREQPPQILFTNPSMLEYILVRNKDVPLLKNSQGKLRWILLDEAHTLTGSAASEMALLIRRVADAFGVETKNLRFAITSATVGSNPESFQQLQDFMSLLCGIPKENIVVITGSRVLPQELPKPTQAAKQTTDWLQEERPETFHQVHFLRKELLRNNALSLSEIGKLLNTSGTTTERLRIIDKLSERSVDDHPLLPVRAHFFARGIGGIWVCTDRACSHHQQDIIPNEAIGPMTTIAGSLCNCGAPVFELVSCRSCGHQLLEAEKSLDARGNEKLDAVSALVQDAFQFDLQEHEEDPVEASAEEKHPRTKKFYFTRKLSGAPLLKATASFSLSAGAIVDRSGDEFVCMHDGDSCPYCDSEIENPNHFRLSSAFINRVLADIILEETPKAQKLTSEMLWQGHKYISFTDSRQGTAKISALINQDNEARWVRSQVFHKLCEKVKLWEEENVAGSEDEIQEAIKQLEAELAKTTLPLLRNQKQKALDALKEQQTGKGDAREKVALNWKDLKEYLVSRPDFFNLFKGNNPGDNNPLAKERYLDAILYDQFALRQPLMRSLENLGLVSLIYPKLQDAPLPTAARVLNITQPEWQSLLKIAVDYVVRLRYHFNVSNSVLPYTTGNLRSVPVFNPDAREVDVRRWPRFDKTHPNRLALLLCAGLGWHQLNDIDAEREDQLNALLEDLWKVIKVRVLDEFGNGYKLYLENASAFKLSSTVWLCPVKRRLIDAHFRHYSPWIKGRLHPDNINHYRIKKEVSIPLMPFPFHLDAEKNPQIGRTRAWIAENALHMREQGVWNNLHEQVILNQPLYLAGEHSAQQSDSRLKTLENEFERGKLNVLNCSTTMEMGVDIGGISTVVMNNVPPAPANYLQRAGRAGRRAEAKSTAFTICAPNPVGLQVMANPLWALRHPIAPPSLSFHSSAVIARHVNAFFLGHFVQTDAIQGLNVRIKVQNFFLDEGGFASQFLLWLQNGEADSCKNALKPILQNTPWRDHTFSFLLSKATKHFEDVYGATTQKQLALEEKLKMLERDFGEDSPAYKAVKYQKQQFQDKDAISFMVEEGFLPSAGLPTGIVEFDTLTISELEEKGRNNQRKSSKPSYFITRALSEFAPGKNVVIDGKSYLSAGIILKDEHGKQAEREIIQSCRKCGYQRILEAAQGQAISQNCPHCEEQNTFTGLSFKSKNLRSGYTEMIQPAGFAVDIYQQPSRNIEDRTGYVQYIDPLLLNVKPWLPESPLLYEIRDSEENGEIVFYNTGAGDGYAVCLHCGRTAYDKDALASHKRLRGGKGEEQTTAFCSGNENSYAIKEHVILGGRFRTDYCELRLREENGSFNVKDETLLYTLGAVLSKELAHYLTVESDEIGFGIKKYEKFTTIFFFDTAKGGAGYTSQLSSYLWKIIQIAQQKLVCECDRACTKCLIDRNTQWHLPQLDRKKALEWLQKAADVKVPDTLSRQYPGLQLATTPLRNEILKHLNSNQLEHAYLYVSNNLGNWNTSELALLDALRQRVKVSLVMPPLSGFLSEEDQLTLLQAQAWYTVLTSKIDPNAPLHPVCKMQFRDGALMSFLAVAHEEDLNVNWGRLKEGLLYKKSEESLEAFSEPDLRIHNQRIHEAKITTDKPVSSDSVADLVLTELGKKVDLKALMEGQSFHLTYSDRYMRTPFGVILLIQFIQRLQARLGFEIDSFTFQGHDFREDKTPYRLTHNYPDGEARNEAICSFAAQIGIPKVSAQNTPLPHYRSLELYNQKAKIILRPDGGIEHGWSVARISSKTSFFDASATKVLEIDKRDTNPLLYTLSIAQNNPEHLAR